MIKYELLESQIANARQAFVNASPFSHVVIDDALPADTLRACLPDIHKRIAGGLHASGDFVFAKNKFVDSDFGKINSDLERLRRELLSDQFASWLSRLVGEPLFVDPAFYGGGLHAGGSGSFLDMHTDFSSHPRHLNWRRRLNILLYLNENWTQAYGGELLLQHVDNRKAEPFVVSPLFNRLVVMETSDKTLHGYDPISFPLGEHRISIAAYAYSLEELIERDPKSTVWYPRSGGALKRAAGKWIPKMIARLRGLSRK